MIFDKSFFDNLQKQMLKAGVVAEPSAAQRVASLLQTAPHVAMRLIMYLSAKQKLSEMKSELVRLQHCVRELEFILEHQGPGACGRSRANHLFVNWMVSFAESYYGLAVALQADKAMLPRVQGYLNGLHRSSVLFGMSEAVNSMVLPEGPIEKMLREGMEQATKNMPAFLKP